VASIARLHEAASPGDALMDEFECWAFEHAVSKPDPALAGVWVTDAARELLSTPERDFATVYEVARSLDPDVPALDRLEVRIDAWSEGNPSGQCCGDRSRGFVVSVWCHERECWTSFASTIAHELRHCAQDVRGEEHGTSPDWRTDLDAYLDQPHERDAREFADRVLERL